MPYFTDGSRACLRCGCVVSDTQRETHVAFHERIDPWPVEEPEPTDPDPITEPDEPTEEPE